MSAWVPIGLLALATAALLLWLGRLPRGVREGALAAILLGLAGYAWQGHPTAAAAPSLPTGAGGEDTRAGLLRLRADMDQHFGPSRSYLVLSDAAAADGEYSLAYAWIRSALVQHPRDPDLWDALGLVALMASEWQPTAAADLSFAHARRLRPTHPGPNYFQGLAKLLAGDAAAANRLWSGALASPEAEETEWAKVVAAQQQALQALLDRPRSSASAGAQ